MTPNGHPVTKAELQEVLEAALTAQDGKLQASLTDLRHDFKGALTAQDRKLQASLTDLRHDFKAALATQDGKLQTSLAEFGQEFKAALTAQDYKFTAKLEAQDDKFTAALTAQQIELNELMRQIETNLLTEFHRYATGQQARMHTLEITDRDLVLRLASIEDRLLALESRRPPTV
jgi:hypothetical protein